jgi:hypothetical protein
LSSRIGAMRCNRTLASAALIVAGRLLLVKQ